MGIEDVLGMLTRRRNSRDPETLREIQEIRVSLEEVRENQGASGRSGGLGGKPAEVWWGSCFEISVDVTGTSPLCGHARQACSRQDAPGILGAPPRLWPRDVMPTQQEAPVGSSARDSFE